MTPQTCLVAWKGTSRPGPRRHGKTLPLVPLVIPPWLVLFSQMSFDLKGSFFPLKSDILGLCVPFT